MYNLRKTGSRYIPLRGHLLSDSAHWLYCCWVFKVSAISFAHVQSVYWDANGAPTIPVGISICTEQAKYAEHIYVIFSWHAMHVVVVPSLWFCITSNSRAKELSANYPLPVHAVGMAHEFSSTSTLFLVGFVRDSRAEELMHRAGSMTSMRKHVSTEVAKHAEHMIVISLTCIFCHVIRAYCSSSFGYEQKILGRLVVGLSKLSAMWFVFLWVSFPGIVWCSFSCGYQFLE